MKSKITFNLKYEEHNGYIDLCFNNSIYPEILDNSATVVLEVDLPAVITIEVSGKNNDTVLDSSGNVVKDKHVEITDMLIDYFNMNETFLYHKIHIKKDNKILNTGNYLGMNGLITINLKEDSVFKQVISCNNKLKENKI